MPNIILLAGRVEASILEENIAEIGPALRQATADAFPDLEGDPTKVCVYIIACHKGDNTPKLQIQGVASWSKEREEHLAAWKIFLADAWIELTHSVLRDYRDFFPAEKVEVWPTMPVGSWTSIYSLIKPGV